MSKEIDIAALRKAAQEATPGPWETDWAAVKVPGSFDWICSMQISNRPNWDIDARYIAAANPAAILALLDRLEQAERDATTLRARHGALQMALERAEKDAARAERWSDVPGYEGYYMVSSIGRVKSLDRVDSNGNRRPGRMMSPYKKAKGYLAVALSQNGTTTEHYVHRLVAQAFLPNAMAKPQVNHIDGDPANNCLSNLEWVTNGENQTHSNRVLMNGVRAVYGVCVSTGERITFPSLQHAVEAGFIRSNIQKCIAGVRKKHRGYTWHDAAMQGEGA